VALSEFHLILAGGPPECSVVLVFFSSVWVPPDTAHRQTQGENGPTPKNQGPRATAPPTQPDGRRFRLGGPRRGRPARKGTSPTNGGKAGRVVGRSEGGGRGGAKVGARRRRGLSRRGEGGAEVRRVRPAQTATYLPLNGARPLASCPGVREDCVLVFNDGVLVSSWVCVKHGQGGAGAQRNCGYLRTCLAALGGIVRESHNIDQPGDVVSTAGWG